MVFMTEATSTFAVDSGLLRRDYCTILTAITRNAGKKKTITSLQMYSSQVFLELFLSFVEYRLCQRTNSSNSKTTQAKTLLAVIKLVSSYAISSCEYRSMKSHLVTCLCCFSR